MKCTAFRERALETGRTHLDSMTDDTRAHAASCQSCAEWVSAQGRLTASLTLMARRHAEETARPRVEAAVLVAFRDRTLAAEAPSERHRSARRLWIWLPASLVAAGVMFAVASLATRPTVAPDGRSARLTIPEAPPRASPAAPTASVAVLPPSVTAVSTPPRAETQPARRASRGTAQRANSVAGATTVASSVATAAPRPVREPSGVEEPGFEPLDLGQALLATATAEAQEYLSEAPFVPLGPADTPVLLEGGQVVRVELSPERARSAGLVVDPAAGRASIRADVVVGHDGVARAIRLIKER